MDRATSPWPFASLGRSRAAFLFFWGVSLGGDALEPVFHQHLLSLGAENKVDEPIGEVGILAV
jgi:hypothetical protein